eukprot:3746159-Pleurochrysis_carterae.AAC.2
MTSCTRRASGEGHDLHTALIGGRTRLLEAVVDGGHGAVDARRVSDDGRVFLILTKPAQGRRPRHVGYAAAGWMGGWVGKGGLGGGGRLDMCMRWVHG